MNEDFKATIMLDPTNRHAVTSLAVYSFTRTLWSDAVQGFTRMLLQEPDSVMAYSHRGRALAHLGNWEDALSVRV